MDIKNINPKNVLAISLAALLAVFLASGSILMVKNVKTGPAGLLDSLGSIFSGEKKSNKTVGKVGSGRVIAVDGDTITVQGTITTTYKINLSGVKTTKGTGESVQNISASDIKTGDIVQVYGTVSDNPVSVTSIVDGVPPNPFSISRIGGLSGLPNRIQTSRNVSASQNATASANINNILKGIRIKP